MGELLRNQSNADLHVAILGEVTDEHVEDQIAPNLKSGLRASHDNEDYDQHDRHPTMSDA